MPRVIVTTDPSKLPDDVSVLLDESVHTVHLATDHGAAQLVERIAWAISDAEETEHGSRDGVSGKGRQRQPAGGGAGSHEHALRRAA